MTKPRISQVLLWILALVTLALFGFFVALVAGAIPVGEPNPPRHRGAVPVADRARRPAGRDNGDEAAYNGRAPPRPRPRHRSRPRPRRRSQRWSSRQHAVIAGSPPASARRREKCSTSGLLAQGESVTLRGARVWMSIGAAANVDVTVNGQDRELQSGTVAVVLGPA